MVGPGGAFIREYGSRPLTSPPCHPMTRSGPPPRSTYTPTRPLSTMISPGTSPVAFELMVSPAAMLRSCPWRTTHSRSLIGTAPSVRCFDSRSRSSAVISGEFAPGSWRSHSWSTAITSARRRPDPGSRLQCPCIRTSECAFPRTSRSCRCCPSSRSRCCARRTTGRADARRRRTAVRISSDWRSITYTRSFLPSARKMYFCAGSFENAMSHTEPSPRVCRLDDLFLHELAALFEDLNAVVHAGRTRTPGHRCSARRSAPDCGTAARAARRGCRGRGWSRTARCRRRPSSA